MPRGNIQIPRSPTDYVKGVSSTIPYVVRNETGDWTQYLPLYEGQKYRFDCNGCWAFSGAHSVETQLNFLWKTGRLPQPAIDWFIANGYIVNGSFEVSWRFIYAVSGVQGNGNNQFNFWQLASQYGLPPRSVFDYTLEQSEAFNTPEAQNADIGSTTGITQGIYQTALQFLSYVAVAYEWVGQEGVMPPQTDINACYLQSPLQFGIAVNDSEWNQVNVPAYSGPVAHAVLGYKFTSDASEPVFDDYQPNPKVLMKGYDIPLITNGVISPILTTATIPTVNPYPQSTWDKVWAAVAIWYQNLFS